MSNVKFLTIMGVLFAMLFGVAGYLLGPNFQSLSSSEVANRVTVMVSTIYMILSVQTTVLLVAGLRGVKPDYKRAYLLLCAGTIFFGLGQTLVALVVIPSFAWVATSGIILLPYILSSLSILGSSRSFAHLLNISDSFTKFQVVLPVALAAGAIVYPLPITLSSVIPTENAFHIFRGLVMWEIVLNSVAAYNIWRVSHRIGQSYQPAMKALFQTVVVCAMVNVQFLILQQVGYDNWYGDNGLELLGLLVVALLFVRTGYRFWAISGEESEATTMNASPLDVVVYLASLASDPKEVDVTMDTIRSMTIEITDPTHLTAEQQQTIGQVYKKLEDYLVTKEQLRSFTTSGLRQEVLRLFPHDPTTNTIFWQHLSS